MIHQIKLLYDNGSGSSIRAISETLKVSRNTVRKYLRMKESYPVCQKRYDEPLIDMVPGVQCQVDPGEIRKVEIDGKGKKQLIYVSTSLNPINTKIFIQMHQGTFAYFEGVPEECVYDQTKQVTIQEEFREVWLNGQFSQFSTYNKFECRVCEGDDFANAAFTILFASSGGSVI